MSLRTRSARSRLRSGPLRGQAPGAPRGLDAGQLGVESRPVIVRRDWRPQRLDLVVEQLLRLRLGEIGVAQALGALGLEPGQLPPELGEALLRIEVAARTAQSAIPAAAE